MIPFSYRVDDEAVRVRLGPWTVRRVALSDIQEIRVGYPFWNEHWCNLWPWRFLTLRRKSGWMRNFVINPPDAEGFAAELRARLPG